MTSLRDFAVAVVNDAAYRDNLLARARAGTLSEEIELLLLELADGRIPALERVPLRAAPQGPTLALIRSSADQEVDRE